jgi:O-antigen/teichoic acid export membrane protein
MFDALTNRSSLKSRILGAGAWAMAGFVLANVLRMGSSLVMTRLLVPEMFGVMAIVNVVITGLSLFSDVGLLPNVVRNPRGGDPTFLNTVWVIQILRGVILWCGALGVCLLIGKGDHFGLFPKDGVYADPRLPYVIAVSSFSATIGGFQSTKLLEARRNLIIGRLTLIDLVAQGAGLVCMLVWALSDRSIWALVSGFICAALTKTILSHTWIPGHRNRFGWDKAALNEIIHFGKWIFLSSIFGFFASNGDRLLLGGLVTPVTLGIYAVAYNIVAIGDQLLGRIIFDLSFPALSETSRERPGSFNAHYGNFHAVLSSSVYLCAGFLITSGQALINVLYDPRYHDGGWMLQILAVGLLTGPFRLATQCFVVFGAPRMYTYIHGLRLIGLLVFTPLGFHIFGLTGALWGIVFSLFLPLPLIVHQMYEYEFFELRRELLFMPFVALGMLAGKILSLAIGHFE